MKIIIEHGDVESLLAIQAVEVVIEQGRISEAGGIAHFCWHTILDQNLTVSTRRKREPSDPDSFVVRRIKDE